MGKNTRGNKEYSRLQEVLHENNRLKKEISRLRKQLARLDLDRHSYVRDIIEEHYAKEDQEATAEQLLKKLKEEWRCHSCLEGHLEIVMYSKLGIPWYFRRCSNLNCGHRTKSQPYSDKVRGIKKETTEKV